MPLKRDKRIDRILDANYNRAKEGLRVCEDICRFMFNKPGHTKKYKTLRHQLSGLLTLSNQAHIIRSRDIDGDVGKDSTEAEFKRTNSRDIFYANSQRVKESLRVLEEFTKLMNKRQAQHLKNLRYKVYDLEKEIVQIK